MSFEKKVWLNVPDENNPPPVPEGQDALARFDADNMNRIEEGIDKSYADINNLISQLCTSEIFIKRDTVGNIITNNIYIDGVKSTYETTQNILLGVGETVDMLSKDFRISLDGLQPSLTVDISCGYVEGTVRAYSGSLDVGIKITDEFGHIEKTILKSLSENNMYSFHFDDTDVAYLLEKAPLLTVDIYLSNQSSSERVSLTPNGTFQYKINSISYTKAQRCDLII